MSAIEEQLECDPILRKTLGSVRSRLATLGLTDHFNRFLFLWDESSRSSDFTPVSAEYPRLMEHIILNLDFARVHDTGASSTEDLQDRLQRMFRLPDGIRNGIAKDYDFEDAITSLCGMIETMQMFQDPGTYLVERVPSDWELEHCDSEEISESRSILLHEFLFEFENFLIAASDTSLKYVNCIRTVPVQQE